MLVAGLAVLLGMGDDDGIYGNYVNQQYGVRLDIQKDVIKFRNGVLPLKAGMKAKKPNIYRQTQKKSRLWTFKIEKSKGGIVYQGAIFKKD